ncbi:MAG: hypothetical protein LBC45_01105 [Chlamydiales bacterium]|jgi:hypothetical protein|nr:hypothetical protein [Chlamydiales bacterium]
MSISLHFSNLTFWSRFHITGGEQSPIKLEIVEKTDKTFRSIGSQTQLETNHSNSFIEDLKELEATTGFFDDLAFLDLEGKECTEKKSVVESIKQNDAAIDDVKANAHRAIANSSENGWDNNNSTKEISPICRSKRIAERNLNKNSSNSIKHLIAKKQKFSYRDL